MSHTVPDVISDEVTKACQKLGLEPRFLFDQLAEGFTNRLEVANSWKEKWMRNGFLSLPPCVRTNVQQIIAGA